MARVVANMAGTILEVFASSGDMIEIGQDVAMMESMKMQMAIQSEEEGTVSVVKVEPGDFVNEGDVILELE